MREIKFRIWEKDSQYGGMRNVDLYWFEESFIREWPGDNNRDFVGDYKLMQYTGLKDKNGKEIYEGDIVKGNNPWENVQDNLQVVKYQDGTWNYSYALHEYAEHPEKDWEIVGNIYENPELLSP